MRFSPDWWAFWSGVWAVSFTVAAALAGLLAWYFSNVASEAREARTRERDNRTDLELTRVSERQEPRSIKISEFAEALKGKPETEVEVLYGPEDSEAYELAMQIFQGLVVGGWGDPANPLRAFPHPIPPNAMSPNIRTFPERLRQAIPSISRLTLSPTGVSLIGRRGPSEDFPPKAAIAGAFRAVKLPLAISGNSELPDDLLLIVVGPKP